MFYTIISINPALSGSLLAVEASQPVVASAATAWQEGPRSLGQLKQVIA
ncbi:hypothetical protein [Massilia sp. YMA4]|nr:hypothetical protein [Massilia sp. YMA4]